MDMFFTAEDTEGRRLVGCCWLWYQAGPQQYSSSAWGCNGKECQQGFSRNTAAKADITSYEGKLCGSLVLLLFLLTSDYVELVWHEWWMSEECVIKSRICIILLMMPFASKVVFCTLSVPCRCVEMRNNRVASGCGWTSVTLIQWLLMCLSRES